MSCDCSEVMVNTSEHRAHWISPFRGGESQQTCLGSTASSSENQERCWTYLRPQAVNHCFFLRWGNLAGPAITVLIMLRSRQLP